MVIKKLEEKNWKGFSFIFDVHMVHEHGMEKPVIDILANLQSSETEDPMSKSQLHSPEKKYKGGNKKRDGRRSKRSGSRDGRDSERDRDKPRDRDRDRRGRGDSRNRERPRPSNRPVLGRPGRSNTNATGTGLINAAPPRFQPLDNAGQDNISTIISNPVKLTL